MPLQVFISHSARDKAIADQVVIFLEAKGISCWYSGEIQIAAKDGAAPRLRPRSIPEGADWPTAIVKGVKACSVMVVVFSANSNDSAPVKDEIGLAYNAKARRILFRIENIECGEDLQLFFQRSQWLDAYTSPLAPHLERLAQAILNPEKRYRRNPWPKRIAIAAAAAVAFVAGYFGLKLLTAPGDGSLEITSYPNGATILEGNTVIGQTGGSLLPPQSVGNHRYEIRESGYKSAFVGAVIKSGKSINLSVKLLPDLELMNGTSLEIDSEPAGAMVFDQTGNLVAQQTPYLASPVQVDLSQNKTQRYEVYLPDYVPQFVPPASIQAGQTFKSPAVQLTKVGKPVPGTPWYNSLGMQFTSSDVDGLVVSIFETRVRDFAAFVESSPESQVSTKWKDPGFDNYTQTPNDPVVDVSWNEAKEFCVWLTKRERDLGLIGDNQFYRLPTDAEWSIFASLGNETGATPAEKSDKIMNQYPWGSQWPPPPNAGNYGGADSPELHSPLTVYYDGFPYTAPVGSFRIDHFSGIYDLGGNAAEWCLDKYDDSGKDLRVIRGANHLNGDMPAELYSSHREGYAPDDRGGAIGFRCVLVLAPLNESKPPLVDADDFIPLAPSAPSK
jgi:formylglycine-generating enzyme required for sulfatase activity